MHEFPRSDVPSMAMIGGVVIVHPGFSALFYMSCSEVLSFHYPINFLSKVR